MNRIVLLTGASRGIGLGILQALSQNPAYQIVATATSDKGLAVIEDCLARGAASGKAMLWNALDDDGVATLLHQIKSAFQAMPDIVINNAGITRDNLSLRMKTSEWHAVIQANLTACFLLSQACSKSMIRQRWGRIVNMSSVVASIGNPGQANYAASKAGVIAMSKSIAAEIASRQVTVNCVCPGFIDTDMLDFLDDAQKSAVCEKIPMGRFGTVAEIAHAVQFLISEESGYITGSCLHVNGGLVML